MSTPSSTPLDYAAAAPRARRFSWSVFIPSAVLCWGLILFCALVVPHFKQIYQNFRLQLPAASQVLFSLSDLVIINFGWAFLLLLPFARAVGPAGYPSLLLYPRHRRDPRAVHADDLAD